MFRRTREKPRPVDTPRRRPILMCPECGSDRACPIEWGEAGEHHWWLLIRCGECEARVQATIGNSLAAALDIELDRQQAQIAEERRHEPANPAATLVRSVPSTSGPATTSTAARRSRSSRGPRPAISGR